MTQLDDKTQVVYLAHALIICARETYEVGTDNVLVPRTLRGYNELQHRVAGAVANHLAMKPEYRNTFSS